MDSNTHSTQPPSGQPTGLAALAAAVEGLAAQDLDELCDAALAGQVLALRGLVDRLEGHWLQQLAAVDGRAAAGAELDQPAPPRRAGCGPACAWAPARPPAVSGRPGRCSVARWPERPRP